MFQTSADREHEKVFSACRLPCPLVWETPLSTTSMPQTDTSQRTAWMRGMEPLQGSQRHSLILACGCLCWQVGGLMPEVITA